MQLPTPVRNPPAESALALEAWNIMGGLDWNALPVVAELLGVTDPESLIHQLLTIRAKQRG